MEDPAFDAVIAEHDLMLFARDRHFDCLPQLSRL
jgi:hypothetical protein